MTYRYTIRLKSNFKAVIATRGGFKSAYAAKQRSRGIFDPVNHVRSIQEEKVDESMSDDLGKLDG